MNNDVKVEIDLTNVEEEHFEAIDTVLTRAVLELKRYKGVRVSVTDGGEVTTGYSTGE